VSGGYRQPPSPTRLFDLQLIANPVGLGAGDKIRKAEASPPSVVATLVPILDNLQVCRKLQIGKTEESSDLGLPLANVGNQRASSLIQFLQRRDTVVGVKLTGLSGVTNWLLKVTDRHAHDL
jgi:hypothetical protein